MSRSLRFHRRFSAIVFEWVDLKHTHGQMILWLERSKDRWHGGVQVEVSDRFNLEEIFGCGLVGN